MVHKGSKTRMVEGGRQPKRPDGFLFDFSPYPFLVIQPLSVAPI
jgi:hypothetical protein